MPKFSSARRAMENFVPYISPAMRARKRDVIIVVYRESQTAG